VVFRGLNELLGLFCRIVSFIGLFCKRGLFCRIVSFIGLFCKRDLWSFVDHERALLLKKLTVMGWLRLVGSLKTKVSFAKEPYKRDYSTKETYICKEPTNHSHSIGHFFALSAMHVGLFCYPVLCL